MNWTDEIRALLLPVAFDRDPRDGLERVMAQQLGPATSAERMRACVDAIDVALASDAPLTAVMPSSHADADVRAYLDAIRARLRARLAPPAVVAVAPSAADGCEQMLDICDSFETLALEERDGLLDEIETWSLDQLAHLDGLDMDAPPSGRDLVIQGLGTLLDAVTAARNGDVAAAGASAHEARRLIALGEDGPKIIED